MNRKIMNYIAVDICQILGFLSYTINDSCLAIHYSLLYPSLQVVLPLMSASFLTSSHVLSLTPAWVSGAVWRWTWRSPLAVSMPGSSWTPATSTCPSALRSGNAASPCSTIPWVISWKKSWIVSYEWGKTNFITHLCWLIPPFPARKSQLSS